MYTLNQIHLIRLVLLINILIVLEFLLNENMR